MGLSNVLQMQNCVIPTRKLITDTKYQQTAKIMKDNIGHNVCFHRQNKS